MPNFTLEIQGHDLVIKTDNGGWETRDRYTGKLKTFSINPELDYSEYGEIDRQVALLAKEEQNKAKQIDLAQQKKKGREWGALL